MADQKYKQFMVDLPNGTVCRVRYYKAYLDHRKFDYRRTDHFEFLDNFSVSSTGYRSHFTEFGWDEKLDPEAFAREFIEKLTGMNLTGKYVGQMRMV